MSIASTDPGDNLAKDNLLFQELEVNRSPETLRFWESSRLAVVVGATGDIGRQVNKEACANDGIPILRRTSGGGAVVIGPGCLNYSLVLSMAAVPELQAVTASYQRMLTPLLRTLAVPGLAIRGISDIAIGDRKISGNSQRRGRHALLHHGTVLYDFDPMLMERYLETALRQPAYRSGRSHQEFVTNIRLGRDAIEQAITRAYLGWPIAHNAESVRMKICPLTKTGELSV